MIKYTKVHPCCMRCVHGRLRACEDAVWIACAKGAQESRCGVTIGDRLSAELAVKRFTEYCCLVNDRDRSCLAACPHFATPVYLGDDVDGERGIGTW